MLLHIIPTVYIPARLTFASGTGQRAFQKVWGDFLEAESTLFKVLNKSQKSTSVK